MPYRANSSDSNFISIKRTDYGPKPLPVQVRPDRYCELLNATDLERIQNLDNRYYAAAGLGYGSAGEQLNISADCPCAVHDVLNLEAVTLVRPAECPRGGERPRAL